MKKYLLTLCICFIPFLVSAQDQLQHKINLQLENHLHSLRMCLHEIEDRIPPEQYMKMEHHIRMCEVVMYTNQPADKYRSFYLENSIVRDGHIYQIVGLEHSSLCPCHNAE